MFEQVTVACITRHGKTEILAPVLASAFGIRTVEVSTIDTDAFGTFTRERKRRGNQLETCIKKACAGFAKTDASFALATEGSFGPHPTWSFIPWHHELITLVHRKDKHVIIGEAASTCVHMHSDVVRSPNEALDRALSWDFPRHGIIVRIHPHSRYGIYKDVCTPEELHDVVRKLLTWPWRRQVFLESDLRAHRNPTRQNVLREAAQDLVAAMRLLCPQCGLPGWQRTNVIPGLPCMACQTPTQAAKAFVHHCRACQYTAPRPVESTSAPPLECPRCNP